MSSAALRSGFAFLTAALVWAAAAERGAAQRPPPGSPGAASSGLRADLPAISGTVVDAATGRPLAAVVSVRQGSGPAHRQATDDGGRFLFSNLAIMTTYSVIAEKPGYRYGTLGASTALGAPQEIRLTTTEWLSNVEIKLIRESTVSGRVLDNTGEPLAGVRVVALPRSVIAGDLRLVIGTVVSTDDRGHYRFTYLLDGDYVLMVPSIQSSVPAETPLAQRTVLTLDRLTLAGAMDPAPHREALVTDGVHQLIDHNQPPPLSPLPDGRLQGFMTTFYPGVRSLEEARAITVALGEQRTGVDIHLEPVPLLSVSGSLAGPPGSGANIRLFLMPQGTEHLGLGHETATTLSGADGRFTFPAVPTGHYTILAGMAATGYVHPLRSLSLNALAHPAILGTDAYMGQLNRAYRMPRTSPVGEYSGRLAVSVGATDVAGVVVPLQRSGSIRGRLVFEGELPTVPAYRREVRAEPANGDPMLGAPQTIAVGAGASNPFALEHVVPGEYVLRAVGIVKSVTWNGQDYTDLPLPISPGATLSNVVVTTTTTLLAARVQGVVRDAQGAPAWDATVITFPADPVLWRRYGVTPRWLASQRVLVGRANSLFMVTVPAGEYFLLALAEPLPELWMDATFLAKAARVATRVSLAWGQTTQQDLTPVALPR